jgi:hypothetical protein
MLFFWHSVYSRRGYRWDSLLFLRIPPYFFKGRGEILHRERREKMNKSNKFSLFWKKTPKKHCFSNPRIDTVGNKNVWVAVIFVGSKQEGKQKSLNIYVVQQLLN